MKNIPCTLIVEEKVSKNTGKTYSNMSLNIKGVVLNIGLLNVYHENALLRAGIDIRKK